MTKQKWQIHATGSTDGLLKALQEKSDNLPVDLKVEFDKAKPYLVGLINKNVNQQGTAFELDASESFYSQDGEIKYSLFQANLKTHGVLAL